MPITSSGKMFLPLFPDRRRIEIGLATQALGVEQELCPLPQRPPQPTIKRDTEALFGALDQRPRYVLVQQLAQQPLALAVANFHRRRHAPSKFHHLVVKQRDRS